MKAWRTELYGIESIVSATTRAAAKATTVLAARDAGYAASFASPCRVRRAPEFDALTIRRRTCLSPESAALARATTGVT